MKTVKNLLLSFTFLFGLTNCSSTLYSLFPDEESKLEMGRQIIEKEDSIAFSSLTFEESSQREYVLDLYVYNKSGEKITVDPKEVYFRVYNEDRKPINKENYFALDPENQISKINEDIENRETDHNVATGLNIAFSLLSTIVDLADDEDNDVEEVAENVAIFADNQINEEISYSEDKNYFENQKDFWKNDVLRITNLDSEESVQGILLVPIFSYAKYVKLFIPLGNTTHVYKFKQISK
ncbi:MAG: hypothetical protein IPM32_04560 [Ignavibacteriae bacterium]|nr:hypothetical protein [Ignavibacteriota bacterium]